MPPAPPPPASPRIDVRSLSVSQLQQLSARGSRRARAELEGRMRASEPPRLATPDPAPHATRPAPVQGTSLPTAGSQGARPLSALSPATRVPAANPPTLTERARPSGLTPLSPAPPAAPTSNAAPVRGASGPLQGAAIPLRDAEDEGHAAVLDEALQMRMALIARQEDSGARTSGPPRLLGMVLIAWAALLVFGGLVSLRHGSGVYYLFCGASAAAVGWLLLGCKRWAMPVHGVLVLIALGWAWRSQGSLGVALVQSAALWIPALWMTMRPVREGLD